MHGLYVTIWLMLWHSLHWRIRSDDDVDDKQKVYFNVDACRRAGEDFGHHAEIFLNVESTKVFFIGLPGKLSPGKYRCEWRLILLDNAIHNTKKAMGITSSGFETTFGFPYGRSKPPKVGQILLKVPDVDYSPRKFQVSYFETLQTPNNTFIILQANVGSEKHYAQYLYFARISVIAKGLDFPTRFKVKEIIGETKFITSHRFSWPQARRFCKSLGLDLCSGYKGCSYNSETLFSHAQPNIPTQFFPVLPYNNWITVTNADGSCDDRQPHGPPPWGIRDTCPREGCRAKTYIYCCKGEKFQTMKYEPEYREVSSARDIYGAILYRIGPSMPNVASHTRHFIELEDAETYGGFWKHTGRIPGDIRGFKTSNSYSKRTQTAIYFCGKAKGEISLSGADGYRYMLDLKPCKNPWFYQGYGYISMKPKKGFRKLYVGQSKQGDGSRISTTPWCCGYTEYGFVIYTAASKRWVYERTTPGMCGGFQLTDATMNVTKFTHSDMPIKCKKYPVPLYCTWRINTTAGNGIHIEYKRSRDIGEHRTTHDYIRFKDPESGRIYSQSVAGSFITEGNSVEITFAEEQYCPNFVINYYAVNVTSPRIFSYKIPEGKISWNSASSLCRNKSLELCTQKDICPAGDNPYGGIADTFTPVSDGFNEWIKTRYTATSDWTCDFTWSENAYYSEIPVWEHTVVGPSPTVHCCEIPTIQWPDWEPVRVYVGFDSRHGDYIFKIIEEWSSPMQEIYPERNDGYRWKPPSTINGSNTNTVDYFVTSNRYVENVFDQVVYFCSRQLVGTAGFRSTVMVASLTICEYPWRYGFRSYAGRTKSAKASVLLTVGNDYLKHNSACCESNPNNFTIYVIDVGLV